MFIIAHRGASALEPENTLLAFQRAIELSVDMIELDLYVHQGRLIVLHDQTLERTTDGVGHFADYSIEELRLLDAGKGEKIPFLEEVLELVRGKVSLNIEIKCKGVAQLLYPMIKDEPSIIISSYIWDELREYRKLSKHARIGILGREPFSIAKEVRAYCINPNLTRLTEGYMRQAREEGYKVFAYTVCNDDDWEKAKRFGVDGCFLDDPLVYHSRSD